MHPQEALLQAARARQAGPARLADQVRRQAVEHRIARLVQLGIRQARYVGRTKTLFQLLMAAAVANLTLVANTTTEGSDGALATGACVVLTALLLARRSRPDGPERPNLDVRRLVPRSPATPSSRPHFDPQPSEQPLLGLASRLDFRQFRLRPPDPDIGARRLSWGSWPPRHYRNSGRSCPSW